MARPRTYDNEDELQQSADLFFEECEKKKKPATITGLAYYLGFESRQSFYDYEKNEKFSYTIKRLRLRIESEYEEALSSNGCTGAIFALKNMGWKDKTEVDAKVDAGVSVILTRATNGMMEMK